MRRRTLAVAVALTAAGLAAAACSATDKQQLPQTGTVAPGPSGTTGTSGTAPGTTRAPASTTTTTTKSSTTSTSVTTAGSTPGTALPAGNCPDKTVLTVQTRAGPKTLAATTAKADVTLDTSAQIIFANYDVPDDVVGTVFQPTLSGDQLGLLIYITTTGKQLDPGVYQPVGPNPNAKLQLDNTALFSAAGREVVGGAGSSHNGVELTRIDDNTLCGTIDTDEAAGVFVAKRL